MINKSTFAEITFIFLSLARSSGLSTVGIDLGCDLIKIGIARPSFDLQIVRDGYGNTIIPSAIFIKGDVVKYGWSALNMIYTYPENVYLHLPCLIGRKLNDKSTESYQQQFPYYKIEERGSIGLHFVHNSKTNASYSVEELVALILDNVISVANEAVEKMYTAKVSDNIEFNDRTAVIAIPSFYGQKERESFLKICDLANITVLKLIDSNNAASMAFVTKYLKRTSQTGVFGMLNIGADSIQMSFSSFENGTDKFKGYKYKTTKINVLSSRFAKLTGTNLIIQKLQNYFISDIQNSSIFGADFNRHDAKFIGKMYMACRKLFRRLISTESAEVKIFRLVKKYDYTISMSDRQFIDLIHDILLKIQNVAQSAFLDLPGFWIIPKGVVLIGGGSNIPALDTILWNVFKRIPRLKVLNPFTDVAWGTTHEASNLASGMFNFPFDLRENHIKYVQMEINTGKEINERQMVFKEIDKKKISTEFLRDFKFDFEFSIFYLPLSLPSFSKRYLRTDNRRLVHHVIVRDIHKVLTETLKPHENHKQSSDFRGFLKFKGVRITHVMTHNFIIDLENVEAVFVKKSEFKITDGDFYEDSLNNSKRIVQNNSQFEIFKVKLPFDFEQSDYHPTETMELENSLIKTRSDKIRFKEYTEKENVKNELEFYVSEILKKFNENDYIICTSDYDRRFIWSFLEETDRFLKSTRLESAPKSEYFGRFDHLMNITAQVDLRVHEMRNRPILIKRLNQLLETTQHFIMNMFITSGSGQSSKGLFTVNETKSLRVLNKDIKLWLNNVTEKFRDLKPSDDPPVLSGEFIEKIKMLDSQHSHLLNLMVKRLDPNDKDRESSQTLIENPAKEQISCDSTQPGTCPIKQKPDQSVDSKPTKATAVSSDNDRSFPYLFKNPEMQCLPQENTKLRKSQK